MSTGEFNSVLEKLPSHQREQVYAFAQFLLSQTSSGVDETEPKKRVLGLHPGAITTSEDFDAPLPDSFWLGEA